MHRVVGLEEQNLLLTTTIAGSYSIPTMIKLTLLLKEDLWACNVPIDIPLQESLNFHSIFVCPISKEVSDPENPPVLLKCGHLVSNRTAAQLLASRSRFKCPTCPVEVTADDIKPIII
jgi:hypothetical protein